MNPDNVAHQEVLDLLSTVGVICQLDEQYPQCCGYGIGDADQSFLGNAILERSNQRKASGPDCGERQGDQQGKRFVRLMTEVDSVGRTQCCDLGQCQVHKDHATLKDMKTKPTQCSHCQDAGCNGRNHPG